ncbi:MAG: HAMP domain-containing sensor histidine kinase [Candidatus Binatia bacterium]
MGMHGCGKHQSAKEFRRWERHWERRRNRRPGETPEQLAERRARWRAAAEASFYAHAAVYGGVITLLAFINLMTGGGPWFLWPALGWGIGIFSHFMGVFGSRMVRTRFFDPAVERELRRERAVMQNEKQASIDELSSTIAHEIRNPIAAAKSLVQQMGEDPHSVENVQYAQVALEELDRVERRISHLLKYAKEEDYAMTLVNLAHVVDSALTQMRAKLDAASVRVSRNYIVGPTVRADAEKLRQVFANVLDNAIDALGGVAEDRRIDLFIENGGSAATVRVRDNGCGMTEDEIDHVFNPFFTTKEKGTGLGLAISRKIVEAHEGTLGVTSTVGRGSEFAVTFPMPGPSA